MMKTVMNLILLFFTMLILDGCGSGKNVPADDDNISTVKLTDLRLGYLVKGISYGPDGSTYNDKKFCNYDVITDIYWYQDDDVHVYYTNQYEIVGENMVVFDNGVIIDTNGTSVFEEGRTYPITGVQGIIFDWYVGSISLVNCTVESI